MSQTTEFQNEADEPVILIVDDDASMRKSLARLIRSAGWGAQTYSCAQEFMECRPPPGAACVLLDVEMPEITGAQLHEWMNGKGMSLPVVFLTAHGDVPAVVQAMKRGAVDFLLKPVDDEVLLGTLRRTIAMHSVEQSHGMRREEIKERHSCLTAREREVMAQVIDGRLNKQIAADLGISVKTVKVHRARAMEKMGVRTVAALVHACYTAGIDGDRR